MPMQSPSVVKSSTSRALAFNTVSMRRSSHRRTAMITAPRISTILPVEKSADCHERLTAPASSGTHMSIGAAMMS